MAYVRLRGCVCANKKRCKCGAKWSFTIDAGKDPVTGKRKQKTVSGFESEKEAYKAAVAMETDLDRGDISIRNNRTLAEFMTHCLTHIIVHEVTEATLEGKWGLFRKHIETSAIGRTHLHRLTADDLQIFYNNLIAQNMGPGSVKNIAKLINQTLNIALEREYISKNANKITKIPTYKPENVEAWNKAQIDHFLNSTTDSYLYPMYMVALNSGLRPGEFFGASWDQIDFSKFTIRIDRTQSTTKEKGNHIKFSPKNSSSVRSVTLPAHVISYLKRYKLEQLPNELNLILPGLNAPIMNTTTARKIIREDCERAGVPYISLHGLRHTHATYLLTPAPDGLGISVKAVSERLGHANTTTTMNTYFSALPNMQDIIAERLEAHSQVAVDKSAKKR